MSYADQLFQQNCREIINQGIWDTDCQVRTRWADDGSPAHTIKLFGLTNRYDLQKEFPLLTLRKTNFKAALDEILWIWQKKSNNIKDLNSHIWDAWADENGSIGKAYGYQLGVKNNLPEGELDQVDMLLHLLRHDPASRRMVSNIFVHRDLAEMALYPCAYSLTLNVSGRVLNGILNQRSQDMLVANNWNVAQYAALLTMFAATADLIPGTLLHVIADAHIYDRHLPLVEKLLKLEGLPAPQVTLDSSINDFYSFTPDSFRVENYRWHEFRHRIPVAV